MEDSLALMSTAPHPFFTPHRITVGGLLAASYIAAMWLSETYVPHPAALFPASAIALSALFLEGIEFWPVVYIAALIGSLLASFPLVFLIIMPIAQTLQAVAGAYILRKAKLDPLFSRSRDTFWLIGTVLFVSLITPFFSSFGNYANNAFSVSAFAHPIAVWSLRYTGSVFCLLILTPFLLRWITKPGFVRTTWEIVEIVCVFALLIGTTTALFIGGVAEVVGIPTVYFLLIPLFWVALRLLPRFMTLALLLISLIAILGLYVGNTVPDPSVFPTRLFQTEEFLIVIAMIFFIIVSLEEDRRLNSNLLQTQVAALENAVARISSESNAKNDFISILGHELRNPLAPVVTAVDLLRAKQDREHEEVEMLAMMEDRLHAVRRLLDDLLNISRIAEGKLSLKKEHVDLSAVLKRAVLSTAHHRQERHQTLIFKSPEEKSLFFYGDPIRIEQVFSNLLTNASKYSDIGDRVSITVKKQAKEVEVAVSDTGIGIDPAVIAKVFTPFYQAELISRGKRGLGIGLALVKSFVEMHGGRVRAESAGVGHGSQFTVWLPLGAAAAAPAKPVPEEASRMVAAPTRKEGGKPSVLVVDDNDAAAAGVGRLLALKGCQVTYGYTGQEAIQKIAGLAPDIAILDIGLPDMDGFAVAKAARAQGFLGRLIALTGYSTEEARAKGVEAGFDHYLIKPASLADLQRVIPEIA